MPKRFLGKGILKNRAQRGLGFFFSPLTQSRLFIVLIATMLFLSCDGQGDPDSPVVLAPEDITIAQVSGEGNADNPIAFIAMTEDGVEVLGVFAEKDASGNPTAITGAFYISELTDAIIIDINSEGLPSSVTDSLGNTILFENYTDSTVDISVFDAEDNLVEGPITVEVDPLDLLEIKELFSLSSAAITSSRIHPEQALRQFEFTVRNSLEWAGRITGAALCIIATVKTGGLALKVCLPVFISFLADLTDDEFDDFISGFVGSGICALNAVMPSIPGVIECVITIVDAALLLFPEPPPEPNPPPPSTPIPTPVLTPEVCHDGIDNDRDGLVDCADQFDCFFHPVCQEVCDDGRDNDRDRLTDCEDPSCDDHPACRGFCPGSNVEFLSFVEGNPEIPGDGLFISPDPLFGDFALAPPFPLSGVTDGVTMIVFPHPSDLADFQGPVLFAPIISANDSCFTATNPNTPPPPITFNGATGFVFYLPQSRLEDSIGFAINNRPECNGFAINDFSISFMAFSDQFEIPFFPDLDAVAIGLGQIDCSNAE